MLRAFEIPMVLYWGKVQLIDRAYLLAHPVDSLVYLHSQPPVPNALALIVLHVSDLTGIPEAAVASGLFASLAFGCFFALLALGARWAVNELAWADFVRRYAAGFSLGVVLVLLWPAKNPLVFGHFVYRSWLDTMRARPSRCENAASRSAGSWRFAH